MVEAQLAAGESRDYGYLLSMSCHWLLCGLPAGQLACLLVLKFWYSGLSSPQCCSRDADMRQRQEFKRRMDDLRQTLVALEHALHSSSDSGGGGNEG